MWETIFEELCRFANENDLDARSFVQRRSEFEILFHHIPIPPGRSLEVGCGSGFLTALLAREGKLAVGVDMAAPDDLTHSRGLAAPAALKAAMEAPNLHFLGSSGELLSFRDGSFDLVLSSYVLEHIGNRAKAVSEMKRVVRDDGLIVALVPSWMERVYAPVSYYHNLVWGSLRSALRFLLRKLGLAQRGTAPFDAGRNPCGNSFEPGQRPEERDEGIRAKLRKFFRVYHPTFPFPRPHGYYRSSSEELRAHCYRRWARLFEGEGLVIERAFATRITPTTALEIISDGTDRAVQGAFMEMLKRRGEGRWMRFLAYSLCFVLRKKSGRP